MMTELLIDRPLREVQCRSHFPDITIGLFHQGFQDTALDLIGRFFLPLPQVSRLVQRHMLNARRQIEADTLDH